MPGVRSGSVLHVAAVDFTVVKLLSPQLQYLAACGFHVSVACGMSTAGAAAQLAPFDPVDLAFPRSPRPRQTALALARLVRLVRDRRAAVLHVHTPAAALAVRCLPRWVWPKGMRLVYTVHGYLHTWPPAGRRDAFVQRAEQRQAKRTDLVLFQSREDLEEATKRNYRSQLRYLGNGVEDDWFALPRPERGNGALRVLYVGRLVREKGVLDLVRAIADTRGVELALVGAALASDRDGVDQEARALTRALGLQKRVRFLGMLSREQLLGETRLHHALVLPSYREGMPRSVNEGLAAARPCIVTAIRGSREIVTHGVNGLVVEPGSVPALTNALQTLADTPREHFARLAAAARATALLESRELAVFERLVSAYAELGVTP